jgi:hypothetical protein
MGQKAATAFSHPGPSLIFKHSSRIVETRVEEHDLDELCAFAHLSDAVDGMRKTRLQ